jgi:hypothetical protein
MGHGLLASRQDQVFEFPPTFVWRIWLGIILPVAISGSVVLVGLSRSSTGALVTGLMLLAIGSVTVWEMVAFGRVVTKRAVLTDDGIDAEPFFDSMRSLRWNEVRGVEESTLSRWGDPVPRIRLIGPSETTITLDGEMPGFDHLIAGIKQKVPDVETTPRSAPWWKRFFPPG